MTQRTVVSKALQVFLPLEADLTPCAVVPDHRHRPPHVRVAATRKLNGEEHEMRPETRPLSHLSSRPVGAIALAVALLVGAIIPTSVTAASTKIGLSQIQAVKSPTTVTRGIAKFSAVPTASQVAALQNLGLTV